MIAAPCRTCGAPVVWCLTDKGKRVPIDLEPTADGNVVVVDVDPPHTPSAHVLTKNVLAAARECGVPLHLSHFVTCPDADTHRKT